MADISLEASLKQISEAHDYKTMSKPLILQVLTYQSAERLEHLDIKLFAIQYQPPCGLFLLEATTIRIAAQVEMVPAFEPYRAHRAMTSLLYEEKTLSSCPTAKAPLPAW